MSSPTATPSTTAPKLQTLNYVNVLAYLSNFLVVFGADKFGLPDNATLSDKYQTLITPAPYAFAIWGIIFTAELVWTIFQVLPSYRSNELVVKSVGYNFALASFAQCAWTILFGLEKIGLSLIAMVSILVPLLATLKNTSQKTTKTTKDYWLLKFPFEIHASWIMAATLLNVNVLSVAHETSSTIQTTIGWASLVILFSVGIYATIQKQKYGRVWVVPCVLLWASFAIASELSSPRDKIVETFSEGIISNTRIASMAVGYLLVLVVIIELVRSRFFGKTTTDDDVLDSDGENETSGEYSSLN